MLERTKGYIKKHVGKGVTLGIILGSVVISHAATRLFYSRNVVFEIPKKHVFEFDLNVDAVPTEMGSGDSMDVSPVIENTSTEEMYVFIEVDAPDVNGEPLYALDANEEWRLIEMKTNCYVYAYGNEQMTVLHPRETTIELTSKITMKNISNADYAYVDNINISFYGYGIDTNGVVSDPESVWNECKALR